MTEAVIETTTKTVIAIDMKTAAEWFANLSDERQADFFVEVAKAAQQWDCQGRWSSQFWLVGRHLRDCSCSTDEARELVEELAKGLKRERSIFAAA